MKQVNYESIPLRFRSAEASLEPVHSTDFCPHRPPSGEQIPTDIFTDDEYLAIPNCTVFGQSQSSLQSSHPQPARQQNKIRMILFESNDTSIPAPTPIADQPHKAHQAIHPQPWFLPSESTGVLAILPKRQSRRNITLLSVTLALPIFATHSSAHASEQKTLIAIKSKQQKNAKAEATPVEATPVNQSTETAPPPIAASSSIPDSAWTAMLQHDVELIMNDGSSKMGRLVGHDNNTVTLSERGSGIVLTIPKHDVIQLRDQVNVQQGQPMPTPMAKPRHSGLGLLIAGAIATGIGGALLISGSVLWAVSYTTFGIPVLASGFVHLGAGIPMTIVGSIRNHRYKRWQRTQSQQAWKFTPVVARTREGAWTGGLQFRF